MLFVLNYCALFILGCFLLSLVIKKDSRVLSFAFLLAGLFTCVSGVICWYHPLIVFGISVVASPRFADALVVTGPVPKAMHEPLRICYQSIPDPKIVIACGTCAISGGVHKGGYAEANGLSAILPVDIFIPGCSPHPWQIIQGLLAARKLKGRVT